MMCDNCLHADVCGKEGVFDTALIYCADFFGWIPVSKRLPTKEEYMANHGVFIVSDGNITYTECFDVYNSMKFGEPTMHGFRVDGRVIAWMPLPKPFEPQESEEV